MVAAYLLHEKYDVELLEAEDTLGGHTNTEDLHRQNGDFRVNTGFIVFNEENYPNFVTLLKRLDVAYEPTSMSFSVKCMRTGLEYGFASLDALFAQRRNAISPRFLRMLLDIRRFRKEFETVLAGAETQDQSLGEHLGTQGYSDAFINLFLVPFGAAIWSAGPDGMNAFPLHTFVSFFKHHGFLATEELLQWQTVTGGSDRYISPLTASFRDRIRTGMKVVQVRRTPDGVDVASEDGSVHSYDRVILATHSDQALSMLAEPTDAERQILGAMSYQPNDVVLHTDTSLMPKHRQTWSSWNYCIPAIGAARCTATYDMNILQHIESEVEFLVTLNQSGEIDPDNVIKRFDYDHPVYTRDSVKAQTQYSEINGVDRIHYAGAYWGYGFHEDGVRSALAACKPLGVSL
jgi:predicted NAD/FAD-binding protein